MIQCCHIFQFLKSIHKYRFYKFRNFFERPHSRKRPLKNNLTHLLPRRSTRQSLDSSPMKVNRDFKWNFHQPPSIGAAKAGNRFTPLSLKLLLQQEPSCLGYICPRSKSVSLYPPPPSLPLCFLSQPLPWMWCKTFQESCKKHLNSRR